LNGTYHKSPVTSLIVKKCQHVEFHHFIVTWEGYILGFFVCISLFLTFLYHCASNQKEPPYTTRIGISTHDLYPDPTIRNMLTLRATCLSTIFFVITASSPVNPPAANTIIVAGRDPSAATGADTSPNYVTLYTYGDPQAPVCNAKVGQPGGVYLCPGPDFTPSAAQQCKWWPPPVTGQSICISYEKELGLPLSRPQSIGPDPGGYCILFKEKECRKEGQLIIKVNGKAYK
jgi:hypothetical protein